MLQYLKTEASKAEDLQEMLTKLQLEKIQLGKDSKDGRQRSDTSALQKQLAALLLEKEELSETLIMEHQKVAQLETQLRQTKSTANSGANAGMSIKIQSLNSEAEDREAVISLVQQQLKQKSEECERLRSALPVQPSDALAQKAKISQFSEQIQELQAEKGQLLKVADELRARASSAIEKQKVQAEELEFLRADTNALSRSKQELQHSLQDQISSLRKENLELRSRHDDLQRASKRGNSSFGSPASPPSLNMASSTNTPHSLVHSSFVRSAALQVHQLRARAVLLQRTLTVVLPVMQVVGESKPRVSSASPKYAESCSMSSHPTFHTCISPGGATLASRKLPAKLPSSDRSPSHLSARGSMQSPSSWQRAHMLRPSLTLPRRFRRRKRAGRGGALGVQAGRRAHQAGASALRSQHSMLCLRCRR